MSIYDVNIDLGVTFQRMAHMLNNAGRTTARGKAFKSIAVRRMLVRLDLPTNQQSNQSNAIMTYVSS